MTDQQRAHQERAQDEIRQERADRRARILRTVNERQERARRFRSTSLIGV